MESIKRLLSRYELQTPFKHPEDRGIRSCKLKRRRHTKNGEIMKQSDVVFTLDEFLVVVTKFPIIIKM